MGAEDAGAQLFLVPVSEVDAAQDADIRVQGVDTLRRALETLSAA